MNEFIGPNILRFVVFFFMQVLIFDYFQFQAFGIQVGFIMIYALCIMLLPIDMPRWLIITLAFVLGISIDMFNNTPGVHTSAIVAMAYFRKIVLDILQPRGGYKVHTIPSIYHYGLVWFLRYTALLLVILILIYFVAEVFSIQHIGIILLKFIMSFISTYATIMLVMLVINPAK